MNAELDGGAFINIASLKWWTARASGGTGRPGLQSRLSGAQTIRDPSGICSTSAHPASQTACRVSSSGIPVVSKSTARKSITPP